MDNTNNRMREIMAALAVFIVIVAIVATAAVTNKKKPSNDAVLGTSSSTTTSTTRTSTTTSSSSSTYKDGQYKATGSYDSPGGSESITVSITIKGNVITDTSATSGAQDPEAQLYQDQFIGGYKQKVVGQNVASVRLSRVSGSSLTSQGFNEALAQIKQQAQS